MPSPTDVQVLCHDSPRLVIIFAACPEGAKIAGEHLKVLKTSHCPFENISKSVILSSRFQLFVAMLSLD
jgi:hypothetical protein